MANQVSPHDQFIRTTLEGPYALAEARIAHGRPIYRFLLRESNNEELIRTAITGLRILAQHPEFVATFAIEPDRVIQQTVKNHLYLTINGFAICLSQEPELPPDVSPDYKDRYFSESWLHEPVRCSEGHTLGKTAALHWILKKGNVCPAGGHLIAANPSHLTIDGELQRQITRLRAERTTQEQTLTGAAERLRALEAAAQMHGLQITTLKRPRLDPVTLVGAAGKVVVKVGGKKIVMTACKLAAGKTAGKAMGKTIAKKLPVVSVVIGVGLGVYRFSQGEAFKGIGEIFSGALACFPGWGTAASVTIDLVLAAHDVTKATESPEVELELSQAYAMLGLNPEESPSQEMVDRAYRQQSHLVHPDRFANQPYLQEQATQLQQTLNTVKALIYQQRNWQEQYA